MEDRVCDAGLASTSHWCNLKRNEAPDIRPQTEVPMLQRDAQFTSRICWFAAGLLAGALAASLCAALGMRRARQVADDDDAATAQDPRAMVRASISPESGSDMFEYRGFVVHLFWQALGRERYKAWCDIWEAGAVVQEAGGPPATYPTAAEARMAAGAWARHWVQNNG